MQPEFEIGHFLTDVAKFPNTAPMLGLVEYQDSDGNNMTLALLQGYVENQGDFWSYTLDYVGRFLEEWRTVAPPESAVQSHSAYLVLIRTLGQRTGELHNALGQTTGDSAFDPEPITDNDLSDWVLRVQVEAVTTLNLLEHQEKGLAESVRKIAQTLLTQRKTLEDRIQTCISGPIKSVKTRYHGDYHLGKALLTQNDFMLIDFEGELAWPFPERRHKHSPLRDVAGMLRSFNYAAYSALAHATTEQPKDLAKLEPLVLAWEAEVRRAFLAAYDEAVHSSGLFTTDASLCGLLDLFLLEKALYEVRLELENRPDWVVIPLRGLLSLLQPMA
jgi:maltose alpha-D-glucosyltransferase/alpha-amylase